ncbi:12220_t:CDS:1 [Gigaspora margarita]|uniref:12220_t:CDS:1 n=1 Tax=Gigaspora margarita TaxID=4874 RepID=A0ABN7UP92_GIGMA|nr:12220_t:CDS:1 [Gigaspora margarita]
MSFLCQRKKQRGPYATKACTNCQRKHIRCSGKATCNHCALHGIECIFTNSGKKRGPRTSNSLQQFDNYGDIPYYFIPYDALQIDISNIPIPIFNQANYYIMQEDLPYQNNTSFNNNTTLDLHNHATISSNLDYLHSEKFYNLYYRNDI